MQKQVFQTNSATRWTSFKWSFRILIVFLIVIITSVVISLIHKHDYDLKVLTYNSKKLPDLNTDKSKKIISKADEIEFAKQIEQYRKRHRKSFYPSTDQNVSSELKKYLPVRAGFYVNWDPNSKFSLERNISKMNMVIPEWIFIDNSKGKLDVRVEENTLEFIRKNKVAVLPMLSNFKQWATDSTYLLLKNDKYRAHLIKQIETLLDTNGFRGINIDFENYPYKIKPYLIQFSKELYETLHPAGYLTTIDVNPTDDEVWYKELAPYYDFIFSMAYNEHYQDGEPGSISSLMFVEKALDDAMKEVPSGKIVLCLAGYGLDWPQKGLGKKVTYQKIISLAKEYNEKVYFNLSQSDITLYYNDDDGIDHEAHCIDAAGTYNIMRTAEDFNSAGVALWYLGSEDQRIWDFYTANLNENYLKRHPYNFKGLEHINAIDAVNYDGKGEIVEVINAPNHGSSKFTYNTEDQLITNEEYTSLPSAYLLKRYGAQNPKKIAITFDDGPNEKFTPSLLDILKQKKVPATFFLTGENIENNIPLVRRIYREGHEIGNHTFTHPNLEVTSDDRERIELRSTRLLIESILGHSTVLFRPPYITDAEPKNLFQMRSLAVARDEGFISVTSYIDTNDWEEGVEADTIVARAKAYLLLSPEKRGNIILMHDAGGERSATVEALPQIIDFYKKNGYQFVTVSELMGKTRDQVMPVVENRFLLTEKLDLIFFSLTYAWDHFLHGFFMVAILLIISRLLMIALLAIIQRIKEKRKKPTDPNFKPKVSIIVPAYNEEVNAERTVHNLLKTNYPDLEIIFVDDGSKDDTYNRVKATFENNPKVTILTKPNGGKAAALNFGIEQAKGEILVCIDADTVLPANAIPLMIPYFADTNVGAVAGNVRVGNTRNLLTNWQSIEYITSQNFDRRAFDAVNAILVVPGAIGAFRKTAMEKIDGFTTDTLAEDCDLTLRLLRAGYRIRTCNEALALTEAPETLNMFLKQRSRWTFGMMQSFWKHRDLLFVSKKLNLSWIALPNLLIFNFIIPFFSPIVDILFIAGLFTYDAPEYIFFYLLYYVIDCIISFMAYKFDNQKFTFKTAVFLFVQRFIYRQLLFYVLFKSYKKALKGELVSWGVLKRTGNVVE
jgi:cellulose synthase/poly-beta-1,6-N-acetylglucosamine synthase-like glycosyltransferase/peptidoglycan/xylan/chitin deacetylase (PgdA/CDA1 family)/spore germination protein YaaH